MLQAIHSVKELVKTVMHTDNSKNGTPETSSLSSFAVTHKYVSLPCHVVISLELISVASLL